MTTSELEQKQLPERALCRRIYETMVLMRATDDRLVTMYRQGQLAGSYYSGNWHEAIAVGTVAALRDDDVIAPTPIPAGSKFWFEVETNGTKEVGSIAWKK